MKKLFYLLPILLLALNLSAPATHALAAAQEYFPDELLYTDAQINIMLPRLEAFQDEYHKVNGRYYQALISNNTAPDVPVVPDGIKSSPTDQPETLAFFWDASSLPDTLAWSFSIDTYAGPDGEGYVLSVYTVVDSETWLRVINYGPDTYRTEEWHYALFGE
jgi:hypothetical protein